MESGRPLRQAPHSTGSSESPGQASLKRFIDGPGWDEWIGSPLSSRAGRPHRVCI